MLHKVRARQARGRFRAGFFWPAEWSEPLVIEEAALARLLDDPLLEVRPVPPAPTAPLATTPADAEEAPKAKAKPTRG